MCCVLRTILVIFLIVAGIGRGHASDECGQPVIERIPLRLEAPAPLSDLQLSKYNLSIVQERLTPPYSVLDARFSFSITGGNGLIWTGIANDRYSNAALEIDHGCTEHYTLYLAAFGNRYLLNIAETFSLSLGPATCPGEPGLFKNWVFLDRNGIRRFSSGYCPLAEQEWREQRCTRIHIERP